MPVMLPSAFAELEDFAAALKGDLPPPAGIRATLAQYEWTAVAERALGVYESLAGRSVAARVPA